MSDAPSVKPSVDAAYEYALPFSHHVEARVDAHLAGQTYNAALLGEVERLREALRSIADNTCCEICHEAALVARAALAKGEDT